MNGIPADKDQKVYTNCMVEIKDRIAAVNAILQKKNTTLYPITNVEFMCLQIRKILELIALASLASHKDEFAKQHQKFAEMWRAKKILEDLEKLNPGFYPVPTEQMCHPKTGEVFGVRAISKPYLTKTDFAHVYQLCSDLLHADNPYGSSKNFAQIEAGIPEWMEKIKRLLNHHRVQLLSSKHQLWVIVQTEANGPVQVNLFERIDDLEEIKEFHKQQQQAADSSQANETETKP